MRTTNNRHHCSSRGTVLVHIVAHPYSTTGEIAAALGRTNRSVWGTVGDLLRCGQIRVYRHNRRCHYYMNPDAPFLHPTVKGYTVGDVFGALAPQAVKVAVKTVIV